MKKIGILVIFLVHQSLQASSQKALKCNIKNPKCTIEKKDITQTCSSSCCSESCTNAHQSVYVLKACNNIVYFAGSEEGKKLAVLAAHTMEKGNLCRYEGKHTANPQHKKKSVCVVSRYGGSLNMQDDEYYTSIIATGDSGPMPVIEAKHPNKDAALKHAKSTSNSNLCFFEEPTSHK